jgi:hypothetical protein
MDLKSIEDIFFFMDLHTCSIGLSLGEYFGKNSNFIFKNFATSLAKADMWAE